VRDKYGQGPVCPDPYTCIPVANGDDAGKGGPTGTCAEQGGQCFPVPPAGWENPLVVWIGTPPQQAPTCPAVAPAQLDGYADLSAPGICGACQCDPPTGSCALPTTITASSSAACPDDGPGAILTPFDPPAGWDGGCTANDAIDGGELCDGGPCVQSFTIAPLSVNESSCAPTQTPAPQDPPSWGTFARTCRGAPFGPCGTGLVCSPSSPPGFKVCIYKDGDNPCPSNSYSERHVFYTSYQDNRTCSASCSCSPPVGSVCSAEVSIYVDGACSTTATYVETVDSSMPACHDLTPGAALGSKSASVPVYTAGACRPSGGPTGAVDPTGAFTVCCIPP
jgi:hypothetical protein